MINQKSNADLQSMGHLSAVLDRNLHLLIWCNTQLWYTLRAKRVALIVVNAGEHVVDMAVAGLISTHHFDDIPHCGIGRQSPVFFGNLGCWVPIPLMQSTARCVNHLTRIQVQR